MANYIGNIPSQGEFKKLDSIASSFNGSTTEFSLAYNSVSQPVGGAEQLIVSLNGVIQEPLSAYTLGIGGASIVFASAPQSGDTCHIVLFGGIGGTVTPSDQSVTVEKLAAELKDYYEDEFTANGTTTDFTLSREAYSDSSLLVSIDGIVQPTSAYNASGTTLTISPALPNGTNIRVIHMGVKAGIYIPQTGTVDLNALNLTSVDSRYYTETEVDSALALKADLAGAAFTGNVTVDTNTFHVDTTNNRVGIGTTSPSRKVAIIDNGAQTDLSIVSSTSGISVLHMGDTEADNQGQIIYRNATDEMTFGVNGLERMRIKSNGNLLVGNTVVNPASGFSTQAGFGYNGSTGEVEMATTADAAALEIGKNNANDGGLIVLRKQGTVVGSIGVNGSAPYFVTAVGSNTVGLKIQGGSQPRVVPTNGSGVSTDNFADLGVDVHRWRDLYLSGGVYLGGTGAANYFDDYEEGSATGTLNTIVATTKSWERRYIKIGNLVTDIFKIVISGKTGGSGNFQIPLSFTPIGYPNTSTHQGGSIGKNTCVTSAAYFGIYGNNPGVYSNTLSGAYIPAQNWSDGEVSFTVIYFTA